MSYSITVMTGLALGQCVKAFALACVPEFMGGQCVSQKVLPYSLLYLLLPHMISRSAGLRCNVEVSLFPTPSSLPIALSQYSQIIQKANVSHKPFT